jgi:hypothetical protein
VTMPQRPQLLLPAHKKVQGLNLGLKSLPLQLQQLPLMLLQLQLLLPAHRVLDLKLHLLDHK